MDLGGVYFGAPSMAARLPPTGRVKMKILFLAATAAAAFGAPASAALLTFEGTSNTIYYAPIVRDGINVGNDVGDEQHFHEIDSTAFSGFVVSNGTGVLYNDRDSRIGMTKVGGGLFNLGNFDASATGPSAPGAVASLLNVSAFVGGMLSVSLDFAINNATFTSWNGAGLGSFDRVVFSANEGGGFQLDNVNLAAAVPEASTWAMLIAGFGLVGATMRRRSLVAA